jgi:hypothetical protein
MQHKNKEIISANRIERVYIIGDQYNKATRAKSGGDYKGRAK